MTLRVITNTEADVLRSHVLWVHARSLSQEHITLLPARQNTTEQLTNTDSLSLYCVVNIAVSLPITVPNKDRLYSYTLSVMEMTC